MVATMPEGQKQLIVERIGRGVGSRSNLMAVLAGPEDRTALLRIIGQCEWELQWVATCVEAIEVFHRTNPSIVICDSELADGDWRQLWDLLDGEPKSPMFIVTSRLADDALWSEVLNVGCYDLLLKPFRAEEVIRVVHAAAMQWQCSGNQVTSLSRIQTWKPIPRKTASTTRSHRDRWNGNT